MRCPKCGNREELYADIQAAVVIKNNEIDEVMEFEFLDEHPVSCAACGYDGDYDEFFENKEN